MVLTCSENRYRSYCAYRFTPALIDNFDTFWIEPRKNLVSFDDRVQSCAIKGMLTT